MSVIRLGQTKFFFDRDIGRGSYRDVLNFSHILWRSQSNEKNQSKSWIYLYLNVINKEDVYRTTFRHQDSTSHLEVSE